MPLYEVEIEVEKVISGGGCVFVLSEQEPTRREIEVAARNADLSYDDCDCGHDTVVGFQIEVSNCQPKELERQFIFDVRSLKFLRGDAARQAVEAMLRRDADRALPFIDRADRTPLPGQQPLF